jgi:hypothetical protein
VGAINSLLAPFVIRLMIFSTTPIDSGNYVYENEELSYQLGISVYRITDY